ncbi:MAG: NupC/NupG family nucleoside CNT transporter [Planctomycetota bacterium]|nr:NupC/NupG family nucleoside CNT transporter [Planctomycetota bacterium]
MFFRRGGAGLSLMTFLQPLLGFIVLIGLAWMLSTNRRAVRWRPVVVGAALQAALALLVLRTPFGRWFFDGAQKAFKALIGHALDGAAPVVGERSLGLLDEPALLALLVLVTVIFFSALFAALHHLGVVRVIVGGMARLMARTMGTSGAESTSAAANIFVGQTEAPLLVRPYLANMTRSEIGAVMTVGFATVAGGVFAIYVSMLQDAVPGIAGHLLAASVMSAPMALAIAKVVFPETEVPATLGHDAAQPRSEYANLVDAAASGAGDGMRLALNILAMLIAFLGLLELANGGLSMIWGEGYTLQRALGVLFAPIAWLLGAPASEAAQVGGLLGTKIAVNEYVAFRDLADMNGLSERSRIVASYALCGFANVGSIAIQIGGLSAIAPSRRAEFARLGPRAMCAGALASFCTAATAAIFIG